MHSLLLEIAGWLGIAGLLGLAWLLAWMGGPPEQAGEAARRRSLHARADRLANELERWSGELGRSAPR